MGISVYEPLHHLKKIDENIWIVDGDIIKMDVKIAKVPFPTRMTVIRLSNGLLWCHSPIKPTPQLIEAMNQLGEVKYLISPNKLHYAYIKDWQTLYPQAIAWASPGVEARAQSQDVSVHFERELRTFPPAEWEKEVDQLIFEGSSIIHEVVFFHKASKTLILTDLIENFELERAPSPYYKCLYKIGGIAHPDGQTPRDLRATFWGRKDLARKSFNKILSWQPERIILAHGKCYECDGVAQLKRAFRWLAK